MDESLALIGQHNLRIRNGIQCPECFGVQTKMLSHRPHDVKRYYCQECGAQWSENYGVSK